MRTAYGPAAWVCRTRSRPGGRAGRATGRRAGRSWAPTSGPSGRRAVCPPLPPWPKRSWRSFSGAATDGAAPTAARWVFPGAVSWPRTACGAPRGTPCTSCYLATQSRAPSGRPRAGRGAGGAKRERCRRREQRSRGFPRPSRRPSPGRSP
ncbi:predicted protein [Clavispora lusitaniae ATCC 42720]|uniref:Uncharacterized protein n=1 Tax=Clavispora lusitaniae (strain ATCC 42720) TaxID=306902 RepID=C4YAZ5_CLAL4|nr:uncharacterized protein CLUG_05460 [Clavispora lusitaniae ATCC 42720]EEQ41331.1 predicted protein [Clavispora lusitaniae ATCC 42720]